MIYKILKTEFTKNKFIFTQLKRVNDKAIYSKVKEDGKMISYEVILIQRHDGYKIAGVEIEPSETYPSSESWGTFGWTYTNPKSAEDKFNKI